jgi:CheY-like chemotaxis protein
VEVSTELGAYEVWRKRFDPAHVTELLRAYRLMRTPMRLLLVDESSTAHEIVGRMAATSRFTLDVDHSDNGAHALRLMRESHYDLALIDAGTAGGMSGLEIACQAHLASPATKLILMASGRARAPCRSPANSASAHF